MNKVKRFLAMLLSVAMVFDSMPAAVIAEQDDQTEEAVEEAGGVELGDDGTYGVRIGKESFTPEKRIIEMVGGSAYYEPETNTLTLSANKGEKITGIFSDLDDGLIYCGYRDDVFTVRGEAEIAIPNTPIGIFSAGDVVIDGDITINTGCDGIFACGSICVNGKLKAKVSEESTDESYVLYSDGKIAINGELEAENATGGGLVIDAGEDIEISGENAYVHVKTVSDDAILFLSNRGNELKLGANVFLTDPAGGLISENRSGGGYPHTSYYVFDKQGNMVKEATIQYVPKTYTVSFNMSGKDATDVPKTQTVPENGYAVKPATDPKAEGFDFAGWCADEDCTEEFDFAKTKISENKTVYAKWTEAETEKEDEKEEETVNPVVDLCPICWNLFEDAGEHVFMISGVSANNTVANSNQKSSAFYEATLTGSEIKVVLKSGADRKKAAKPVNTVLEFKLGDGGIVEYSIPVQYVKPSLKLSKTSAPIVDGKAFAVVNRKMYLGVYEPYDLSDATLSYTANGTVSGNKTGIVTISNVQKGKGRIGVKKAGWAETIKIKFTVKAATDVYVDLGDLKTVVVNKNAPDQKQIFDFYANGEVKISDKKNTGLITISGNKAIIAYKSGVKKGTYKIKLTVGKSSQTVKVKVSEKALENSVKMSVKGKYDVVTKQRMVLLPQYKEISGKILSVSSDTPGYIVSLNAAGNVVVGCTTDDNVNKGLKMKDLSMKLTIEGVSDPVAVNVKKIKAKKTTPTFAKVEFSMPNGAGGTSNAAVANLVYTYKDSAKMLHEITPEKLEVSAKSCKAELKDGDNGHVYIKDLSEKKGTVTLTAYFPFGVKRKGSIKLKKSN